MKSVGSSLSILSRALSLAQEMRKDGQGVYIFLQAEQKKAWVGRPRLVVPLGSHRSPTVPDLLADGPSDVSDFFESLQNHLEHPAFFLIGPHLLEASRPELGPKGLLVLPALEIELDEAGAKVLLGSPGPLLDFIDPLRDLAVPLPITSGWSAWESEEDNSFLQRVESIVNLMAGRSGKSILTRRFSRSVPAGKDPLALAALLLGAEPGMGAAHFLELPGRIVSMGTSPENVFEVIANRLVVDAVAGSRPVVEGRQDDESELELFGSEKEGREHGMALDRAYSFAEGLCEPETLTQVFARKIRRLRRIRHLHSRVGGTLKHGVNCLHAMAAAYPPLGSYPAALRQVEEPWEVPPMFYGGMVGRWDSGSDCSAFLNIRALEIEGGSLSTRSGAGIVDGADALSESSEIMLKLGTVIDAVETWLA